MGWKIEDAIKKEKRGSQRNSLMQQAIRNGIKPSTLYQRIRRSKGLDIKKEGISYHHRVNAVIDRKLYRQLTTSFIGDYPDDTFIW